MDCFAEPVIRRRFAPTGWLAMTRLAHPVRQTGMTGKSLRIIRNRVNPANQKYSAFVLTQISPITPPVSPD
jgi:hypothetical protein